MKNLSKKNEIVSSYLNQLLSLQPVGEGVAPIWDPNGEFIYFQHSIKNKKTISSINLNDGKIKKISDYKSGLAFLSSSMMTSSPDGQWLSYLNNEKKFVDRKSSNRNEIWLQPTSSGKEPIQLTKTNSNINSYNWSKDNENIVFSTNLFGSYDIFRVRIIDQKIIRLTSGENYEVFPIISDDCEKIYFVQLDETWTKHTIMVMNFDGSDIKPLVTDENFFDYHYGRSFGFPILSKSTNSIIFPSNRSGWINYWRKSLNGENLNILCPEESDQTEAQISPDGSSISFVSNTNGTTRLTTINFNEPQKKRKLVFPEIGIVSSPSWSPNGDKIAYYFGTPSSPSELYLVNLNNAKKIQLTSLNNLSKLKNKLVSPKKISYYSFDNMKISAYLYTPPNVITSKKFPAIVIAHGGPTSQFMDVFRSDVQYFVQNGFVVMLPNIRGSSGYGKKFEDSNYQDWGHGDLRDIVAGVDILKSLGYVNKSKISIHGTSYGGCISMSAVCFAPDVFHTAIPHAGYSDWLDFNDVQELRHRQLLKYKFGDINNNRHVYKRCSPIYHVSNVRTPVFLVHGQGHRPSSDASLKFANALEKEYKSFEYKIYPNECYYVQSKANLAEMYQDIIEFLNRF